MNPNPELLLSLFEDKIILIPPCDSGRKLRDSHGAILVADIFRKASFVNSEICSSTKETQVKFFETLKEMTLSEIFCSLRPVSLDEISFQENQIADFFYENVPYISQEDTCLILKNDEIFYVAFLMKDAEGLVIHGEKLGSSEKIRKGIHLVVPVS